MKPRPNEAKTDNKESRRLWESLDAAFDLAQEHFSKPLKKIEMNKDTYDRMFDGNVDKLWGADVIVNEGLSGENIIFECIDPSDEPPAVWDCFD